MNSHTQHLTEQHMTNKKSSRRVRQLSVMFTSVWLAGGAMAQPTAAPSCPFSAEQVSRHFGKTFKPGSPEAGLLGRGCVYASTDPAGPKLWIDAGPNPFPSLEMYRKISAPAGTRWREVPGDPDKAVHTIPRADVPPFPSLSYERKGWIISLTVTGFDGPGSIDTWNSKLVKLPRLP